MPFVATSGVNGWLEGKSLSFVETIVTTVRKGGEVGIVGFGTFKQVKRAARKARNPATGESIKLRAKKMPKFIPGAPFKAAVAGPAAKTK
jgi:DNA-binding protein HU-beta